MLTATGEYKLPFRNILVDTAQAAWLQPDHEIGGRMIHKAYRPSTGSDLSNSNISKLLLYHQLWNRSSSYRQTEHLSRSTGRNGSPTKA